MTNTLYFEASVCPYTGAMGWGGVLKVSDGLVQAIGGRQASAGMSPTCATLAAAQAAFQSLCRLRWAGQELVLATRSTAAVAVLRWVFPGAPYEGVVEVHPPKKLKPEVKDFQPLYDLHEDVERSGAKVLLQLVSPDRYNEIASGRARQEMETARNQLQRRA